MTEAPLSPDYPASVVGGELRLPKPPGVVRRFWARHPWLTDALIAGDLRRADLRRHARVSVRTGAAAALDRASRNSSPIAVAAPRSCCSRRRTHPWLLARHRLARLPRSSTRFGRPTCCRSCSRSTRSPSTARRAPPGSGSAARSSSATASAYIAVWCAGRGIVAPFGADAPGIRARSSRVLMLIATLIGVTVGNRRRYLERPHRPRARPRPRTRPAGAARHGGASARASPARCTTSSRTASP